MRRVFYHPLYRALALALVVAGLYPGLAAMAPWPQAASAHSAATYAPVEFRGILVAIHRTQLTGDLAMSDGTLLPVRFAAASQEHHLQVGARLLVAMMVHGHARLLVQTVRVTGRSTRVHLHATVARLLPRETIEILGRHGAAVMLRLTPGSGPATLRPRATPSGTHTARVIVVSAGTEIDADVGVDLGGRLTALRARLHRGRATRVEVEGIIRAINPTSGTITIEDEDGQRTVVAIGPRAKTYYVGEHAIVSGNSTGRARSDSRVDAVTVEPEDAPAPQAEHRGQVYPAATRTAASGTPDQHGTPTAAGEGRHGNHGGQVAGCYYSCPPTPVGTAAPPGTPAAGGDDHRGAIGTCYYTCPPSPTASATPNQQSSPTASVPGDDGHSGGGNGGTGGVTGCYYTCPPAATSTAIAPQATPALTVSSDDNHSGGGVGCYYACPPTPTATSTVLTLSSTATPTAIVQAPTATPTDDAQQRGKPTPSATVEHS